MRIVVDQVMKLFANRQAAKTAEVGVPFEDRWGRAIKQIDDDVPAEVRFDDIYTCQYMMKTCGAISQRSNEGWILPWAGAMRHLSRYELDRPTLKVALMYWHECTNVIESATNEARMSMSDLRSDLLLNIGSVQIGLGELADAQVAFNLAKQMSVEDLDKGAPTDLSLLNGYAVDNCLKKVNDCIRDEGSDHAVEVRMAAFTN